ncbi:MAG: redoxin domain-containing protein [Chitinophagaceae bacterium]
MKKFLTVLLIVSTTITCWGQEGLPLQALMPKGGVRMKDISGELVSLDEVKTENGILVMFSCNTCPYVKRNESRTKEILEYADSKHIGVMILNSNEGNRNGGDSYADMQNYAKLLSYRWKYALDSHHEIADAFGANRTPECFLFDSSGKLVYHGAIDDSPADNKNVTRMHLKEAINEMISGREVSLKESRSVGCTIQRKQ